MATPTALPLHILVMVILSIFEYTYPSRASTHHHDKLFSREGLYIIPRVYLTHRREQALTENLRLHEEFGIFHLDDREEEDEKLEQLFSSGLFHNFHSHTLYFLPKSKVSLFKWLGMVLKRLPNQKWHPEVIFHWPISSAEFTSMIINQTKSTESESETSLITWKEAIRLTLIDQIAPLFRSSVDIRRYIYFVFTIKKESTTKGAGAGRHPDQILASVWEVYYINGIDDSNLVVQEVLEVGQDNTFVSVVSLRADLRQTRLTVIAPSVLDTKSELDWREEPDGSLVLQGGQSLDILHDFKDFMNFRYVLTQGDWIGRIVNGTTSGKTAELLRRNQVDLMIGQSVPISVRTEVLDYLLPTSTNSLRAFLQQPSASNSRNLITGAVEPTCLLVLLTTLIILLISVRAISWALVAINFKDEYVPSLLTEFGVTLMWITGMVTQQGTHLSPKSCSLRTIFLTASLTGLICYIAYAAVVISVLSLETLPIQSVSQLLESTIPIYASDDSVLVEDLLRNLEDSGRIRRSVRYLPVNLGVHFTLTRPAAYVIYAHQFHTERQKQGVPDYISCKIIYSFPLTEVYLPSAMAVPKNSPFRKYFNHRILSMAEHGLLHRYRIHRDHNNGVTCPVDRTRYREKLGLDDIATAIGLLIVGVALCIVALVVEQFYVRNIHKIRVLRWLCFERE